MNSKVIKAENAHVYAPIAGLLNDFAEPVNAGRIAQGVASSAAIELYQRARELADKVEDMKRELEELEETAGELTEQLKPAAEAQSSREQADAIAAYEEAVR